MNKVAMEVVSNSGALSAQELELAQLIVKTLNLEVQAADVDPVKPLYGEGLGLDSIDILEIAWAIYLVEQGQMGLAVLYGISHSVAYVTLLYFFGRTLMPGAEALITRLARRVHGTLPQEMETYTRRLTIAWCLFFVAQIIMSAL